MIAVTIRVGHLDHMPRCVVTRRIAHFCAHCGDNSARHFTKLNEPAAPATRAGFCARSDVKAAPGTLVASPAHGEAK